MRKCFFVPFILFSLVKAMEHDDVEELHPMLDQEKRGQLFPFQQWVRKFKNGPVIGCKAVDFSKDGEVVAAGFEDGTIGIFSKDGDLIRNFKAHSSVLALKFLSSGELRSVSNVGELGTWSKDGVGSSDDLTHGILSRRCAFSADGKVLVCGGEVTGVSLFKEGKFVKHIETHSLVTALTISQDGENFAFAQMGEEHVVLGRTDEKGGIALRIGRFLPKHKRCEANDIHALAISPDQEMLAAGCLDGTIVLCGLKRSLRLKLKKDKEHLGIIDSLAFSPDSQILISTYGHGAISFWTREGECLRTCRAPLETKSIALFSAGEMALGFYAGIQFWRKSFIKPKLENHELIILRSSDSLTDTSSSSSFTSSSSLGEEDER